MIKVAKYKAGDTVYLWRWDWTMQPDEDVDDCEHQLLNKVDHEEQLLYQDDGQAEEFTYLGSFKLIQEERVDEKDTDS